MVIDDLDHLVVSTEWSVELDAALAAGSLAGGLAGDAGELSIEDLRVKDLDATIIIQRVVGGDAVSSLIRSSVMGDFVPSSEEGVEVEGVDDGGVVTDV